MLATTTSMVHYTIESGSASETYQIPFTYFGNDDIHAVLSKNGESHTLTYGTDFTVTEYNAQSQTRTLTRLTDWPAGYTRLTIFRVTPIINSTDLINGDYMDADFLENLFDRVYAACQELRDYQYRSIHVAKSDPEIPSTDAMVPDEEVFQFGDISQRANTFLYFDAEGKLSSYAISDYTHLIETITTLVSQANTYASDALTAKNTAVAAKDEMFEMASEVKDALANAETYQQYARESARQAAISEQNAIDAADVAAASRNTVVANAVTVAANLAAVLASAIQVAADKVTSGDNATRAQNAAGNAEDALQEVIAYVNLYVDSKNRAQEYALTAQQAALNASDSEVGVNVAKEATLSARDIAVAARDVAVAAKDTAIAKANAADISKTAAAASETSALNAKDTAVSQASMASTSEANVAAMLATLQALYVQMQAVAATNTPALLATIENVIHSITFVQKDGRSYAVIAPVEE